jgi:hypothetical protein
MFGIPLHAWGEKTFKNISSRCAEFIGLDEETLNRSRFDVARVRIETSLLGFIDFVIKLKVQGAMYKVRVVEESEGPKELEGMLVEDQLAWSVAASSCNSGGGRPARAVLEGLDDQDADGDASERCHQEIRGSMVGFHSSEKSLEKAKGVTEERLAIPGNVEKEIETEEGYVPDVSGVLRGSVLLGRVDRCGHQVEDLALDIDICTPPDFVPPGLVEVGPIIIICPISTWAKRSPW